jgi:SAM-dependent methyltransferase
MSAAEKARILLNELLHARAWRRESAAQRWRRDGRIPWARGYIAHRDEYIAAALSDPVMMARFARGERLPAGYGIGIDERCVEIPWLLAGLDESAEHMLDAGSALNHAYILQQRVFQHKRLDIATLAPERNRFRRDNIVYLNCDLRRLPYPDACLDTAVSISTLEHVGMDNRQFTGCEHGRENRPRDFLRAVSELRRALKPGGVLHFSVPYGRYSNLGSQQVFDAALLEAAIEAFEPAAVSATYFRYSAEGWRHAAAEACGDSEYVEWVMLPKERREERFPLQHDGAAAARAVACVRLETPKA